jgi:hypothetical protein
VLTAQDSVKIRETTPTATGFGGTTVAITIGNV